MGTSLSADLEKIIRHHPTSTAGTTGSAAGLALDLPSGNSKDVSTKGVAKYLENHDLGWSNAQVSPVF